MPEHALSRFFPLPDVSATERKTFMTVTTNPRHSFRQRASEICAVESVDLMRPYTFCCETRRLNNKGDSAFKNGSLREAVHAYNEVLQKFPNACATIRANCFAKRSASFALMSCELRTRPVDACALYGMDATRLASLALKDAAKVIELFPEQSEGFLRSAFARYLLEQYQQAMDDCYDGLRWNIDRSALKECLKLVEEELTGVICQRRSKNDDSGLELAAFPNSIDPEDFDCKLCMKLLYEPVTTPCGHSFCASCLQRSLDHSNKCPLCRTVMHVSRPLPVSMTLKSIISRAYPKNYDTREAEMNSAVADNMVVEDETCSLPLFVLFTLFPGEKMSLNVFEPRYRLMVRRVMEGSRRFGMIQSCCQSESGVCLSGTECEIVECEPLADGRYFLEVVGKRRFDVESLHEQDGYRVAKARFFHDSPVQPDSQESDSIRKYVKLTEKLVQTFKARGLFNRQGGFRWNVCEKATTAQEIEKMSFLACAMLVNPDGSPARRRYLDCRSTLQRMEWILQTAHQTSS